jgi:hypothetical protein
MPPSPISGVWQSVNLPFQHIHSRTSCGNRDL